MVVLAYKFQESDILLGSLLSMLEVFWQEVNHNMLFITRYSH